MFEHSKTTKEGLKQLFEVFSLKCSQLHQAIRAGQEDLVRAIDRELDPLVSQILDHNAASISEVYLQLQFISSMIREDANDRSCVVRHSTVLSVLIDRYFGDRAVSPSGAMPGLRSEQRGAINTQSDDVVLNEAILDSLPDRIAVLTTDYRYLYSNSANTRHLQTKTLELIGQHLGDIVGHDRFEREIKNSLNRCFAGEIVEHHYPQIKGGATQTQSRMAPLRTTAGTIVGAIVTMRDSTH